MSSTTGKRKSRFDDSEDGPEVKKPNIDLQLAAARAAAISSELSSKIAAVSSLLGSVPSLLPKPAVQTGDRKAAYRPLLLDAQGREIDEHGNLVKSDAPIKTLAANVAVTNAQRKKENPYLAHRTMGPPKESEEASEELGASANMPIDLRIPSRKRELKAKRALNFIEQGTFVQEAEKLREKEERKIIAGYASGRKNLQQVKEEGEPTEEEDTKEMSIIPETKKPEIINLTPVPAPQDIVLPKIEWWDELFLPKQIRENRKISKAAAEKDDSKELSVLNNRTYKYIQHPVPIKPLGGEKPNLTLPMYLTKQERKKLRKSTRQEREMEKRDKQMMGLLPAPEPKFKLSNFMKVLGDQAVADPSKVELKVLQQMQQRVLNHEMRNQAAKLTPQQKREKKLRKFNEDTSRTVFVAVFRIRDFSNLKFRFKVDVNAQQHFLSGIALLCPEERMNLVVAEGGPKGINKFIRLLTVRIPWDKSEEANTELINEEEYYDDDDDEDEIQNDNDNYQNPLFDNTNLHQNPENPLYPEKGNRCDLLWRGNVPKRLFTGFKFQETKSRGTARKLLEARGASQYWDMLERADQILSSEENILS